MNACTKYAGLQFTRRPQLIKAASISVNRERALVRRNEIGLRRRLKKFLKHMGKQLAQAIIAKYDDLYKAELPPLPPGIAPDILDLISAEDFDALISQTEGYIGAVSVDGAKLTAQALEKMGGTIDAQVAMQNAEVWARHRAAEMVGRKYVDGVLVTNPNAHWAITESTRDLVRAQVNSAIANGSTVQELATALREGAAFSEERALMIARTEINAADSAGAMESYKECPEITGKRWVTAGDDAVSDICLENEADGDIPIGDSFSSGDDSPPGHPNCRCVISPVFSDEMTN